MSPRHPTLCGYTLLHVIGRGEAASVWLAQRGGRRVALKCLHPHHRDEPARVQAFVREAQLLASFDHPHLVRALDLDASDAELFSVLELVDGPSLHGLRNIVRARTGEQAWRLDPELCAVVVRGVALALAHVHAHADKLVHGDVAPSNVLVSRHGELKLIDLSAVRVEGDTDRMTRPRYAPPEAAHAAPMAQSADVYALGVMAWELMAGARYRDNASALHGPQKLTQEIAQMLSTDAARRPRAADVFAHVKPMARHAALGAVVRRFGVPSLTTFDV